MVLCVYLAVSFSSYFSDGLGTRKDVNKALRYFQLASHGGASVKQQRSVLFGIKLIIGVLVTCVCTGPLSYNTASPGATEL